MTPGVYVPLASGCVSELTVPPSICPIPYDQSSTACGPIQSCGKPPAREYGSSLINPSTQLDRHPLVHRSPHHCPIPPPCRQRKLRLRTSNPPMPLPRRRK